MVRGPLLNRRASSGGAASRRSALVQVATRLGWGVADQAVSSVSNFALGLYVARTFGARTFGAFTLAYVTYSVVLNASRGLATDPLLVRHSGAEHGRWRAAVRAASATALVVGVVVGLVCVVVGLMLPAPVGPVFVALGVGLPGLMLQDSWRFAFFAAGRGVSALLNDLFWTVLLILGLVGLHLSGDDSAVTCLIAFGGTATLAAALGVAQTGVVPSPAEVGGWIREHKQLSVRYLTENVSISGATQVRAFALGALATLAAVGQVRTAEILMGPFVVVLMGISQVAVPEAARVFARAPGRLARFCLLLGGVQAVAALAWGLTMLVALPAGLGALLLHDLWVPAAHLLPGVMLNVAAACFSTAATSGLRAMGLARRSLRAQLVAAALYVVGGVGGAAVGGATGTVWGVAAATTIGSLVWWHQLLSALRPQAQDAGTQAQPAPEREPEPEPAPEPEGIHR